LIVRASLPYLEDLRDKLFTFISISTPHLGYLHNSHKLIKFGKNVIFLISDRSLDIINFQEINLPFITMYEGLKKTRRFSYDDSIINAGNL